MPKIIKTTNTKGGTNKSRYRGGEERWGEGGGEIFAYKNQHIFGARTICTSEQERERGAQRGRLLSIAIAGAV